MKIRAWDSVLNKYVDGGPFSLYGEVFFLFGFANTNDNVNRSDVENYVKTIIFERSVGCVDANGNDIFEGDIVQYGYRDGYGVVIYDDEDGAFNIDPLDGCVWIDVFRDNRRWYQLTVEGNIHDYR